MINETPKGMNGLVGKKKLCIRKKSRYEEPRKRDSRDHDNRGERRGS